MFHFNSLFSYKFCLQVLEEGLFRRKNFLVFKLYPQHIEGRRRKKRKKKKDKYETRSGAGVGAADPRSTNLGVVVATTKRRSGGGGGCETRSGQSPPPPCLASPSSRIACSLSRFLTCIERLVAESSRRCEGILEGPVAELG